MRQKLLKKVVVLAMALMMIIPAFAFYSPILAVNAELDVWGNNTGGPTETELGSNLGLGNKDPRNIVSSVINIILGFLGVVAVVIILLGGFKWMTAGGNEDKVGEAKKLIVAGIIGLVIILASFAIATFVLNQLLSATSN